MGFMKHWQVFIFKAALERSVLLRACRVHTICLLMLLFAVFNTAMEWRFVSNMAEGYFFYTVLVALVLFFATSVQLFMSAFSSENTSVTLASLFLFVSVLFGGYAVGHTDFQQSSHAIGIVSAMAEESVLFVDYVKQLRR